MNVVFPLEMTNWPKTHSDAAALNSTESGKLCTREKWEIIQTIINFYLLWIFWLRVAFSIFFFFFINSIVPIVMVWTREREKNGSRLSFSRYCRKMIVGFVFWTKYVPLIYRAEMCILKVTFNLNPKSNVSIYGPHLLKP